MAAVRHLTTEELAERLGGDFSVRTLEDWRLDGKGPKFIRPGGKVRYRLADIEAWEESVLVQTGTP
jgi:predicted site-specific integrase-resolvase